MQDITIRFSTRPESDGEIVGVSYARQHADEAIDGRYQIRGGIGSPLISFAHARFAPDPEALEFLTDPLFDHISGRERPTIKKMCVWIVKRELWTPEALAVLDQDYEVTVQWGELEETIVNVATGRTLAETT
jgi:hypothetical protein